MNKKDLKIVKGLKEKVKNGVAFIVKLNGDDIYLGDTSNDSEIKVDETLAEYLTPNEAASYLQVSRPYIMKLITDKVLSAHKRGAHNKVHLKDVVALKNSWSNDIIAKSEKMKKGLGRFVRDEGLDE